MGSSQSINDKSVVEEWNKVDDNGISMYLMDPRQRTLDEPITRYLNPKYFNKTSNSPLPPKAKLYKSTTITESFDFGVHSLRNTESFIELTDKVIAPGETVNLVFSPVVLMRIPNAIIIVVQRANHIVEVETLITKIKFGEECMGFLTLGQPKSADELNFLSHANGVTNTFFFPSNALCFNPQNDLSKLASRHSLNGVNGYWPLGFNVDVRNEMDFDITPVIRVVCVY